MQTIWTVGHSTRSFEEFVALLKSFNIQAIADIRQYPGSRRYPHFNKEALEHSLPAEGIKYIHLKQLGGRKKASENSVNTGWKNDFFRGYADYMETSEFHDGVTELEQIGSEYATAYMCSEAVWWRCHRSLVSDYLKVKGWKVMHIMNIAKSDEHPYTKPARIEDGKLNYRTLL